MKNYLVNKFLPMWAKETVLRLFKSMIDKAPTVGLTMDWKTTVQERLREHDMSMPEYEVTSSGPEHDKNFFATLSIDGVVRTRGQGRTKKEAEHQAAREMVEELEGRDTRA